MILRDQSAVILSHAMRSSQVRNVPPAGFEPAHPPPEGGALSPELRGLGAGTRVSVRRGPLLATQSTPAARRGSPAASTSARPGSWASIASIERDVLVLVGAAVDVEVAAARSRSARPGSSRRGRSAPGCGRPGRSRGAGRRRRRLRLDVAPARGRRSARRAGRAAGRRRRGCGAAAASRAAPTSRVAPHLEDVQRGGRRRPAGSRPRRARWRPARTCPTPGAARAARRARATGRPRAPCSGSSRSAAPARPRSGSAPPIAQVPAGDLVAELVDDLLDEPGAARRAQRGQLAASRPTASSRHPICAPTLVACRRMDDPLTTSIVPPGPSGERAAAASPATRSTSSWRSSSWRSRCVRPSPDCPPCCRGCVAGVPLTPAEAGLLGALPPFCFAAAGVLGPVLLRRAGRRAPRRPAALALRGRRPGRPPVGGRPAAPSSAFRVVALLGMGLGNVVLPVLVKAWFPHRIAHGHRRSTSWGSPPARRSRALLAVPVADAVAAASGSARTGWQVGRWPGGRVLCRRSSPSPGSVAGAAIPAPPCPPASGRRADHQDAETAGQRPTDRSGAAGSPGASR